jgi:hypothetical protein
MTISRQMSMLPELRRWRKEKDYFTGYVYNDGRQVWDEGEFTDFSLADQPHSYLVDCGLYFIIYINATPMFRLNKDDEIK